MNCWMALAMRLQAHGKDAEAEQECRAALKVIDRVFGVEDMWTLSCHVNLASILRDQNKTAEAEKEYRDTLAVMDRVNRADNSDDFYIPDCCYGLGLCLESEGKLPEALQLFQRAEKVWNMWIVEGRPARNPAKEARERIEAALKK